MKRLVSYLIIAMFFTQFLSAQKTEIDKKLSEAVWNKNARKVKKYIKKGANVNMAGSGRTLLQEACLPKDFKIAKILITNGADVNAIKYEDGNKIRRPIFIAIRLNNIELTELLIKSGANLNVRFRDKTPLLLAFSDLRSPEIARKMIENGASVNEQMALDSCFWGFSGYTPLLFAIYFKDFELAKFIIEKGANPNVIISKNAKEYRYPGYSPLLLALKMRNFELAKLLIENGASVNEQLTLDSCRWGFSGYTPLLFAIYLKDFELAKLIIEKGANPNVIISKNAGKYKSPSYSPLLLALKMENYELAKLLIKNGADVNTLLPSENQYYPKYSPLLFAIKLKNYEFAKYLIKSGAKVNTTNKELYIDLLIAVKEYNPDTVKMLLNKGADINARYYDNNNILHIASQNRYGIKVIEILLEQKMDVNSLNIYNQTPLYFAVNRWADEIAETLLKSGANPNIQSSEKNTNGWTPLMLTAKSNSIDCAILLMEFNADKSITNKKGQTALDIAKEKNNLIIIEIIGNYEKFKNKYAAFLAFEKYDYENLPSLIQKQENVNLKYKYGRTLLHHAIIRNKPELVKKLLQLKADPNILSSFNYSPLMFAAQYSDFDIFNILIAYGADPSIKDNDGKKIGEKTRNNTPIIIEAVAQNNYNVVKILLENGADVNATMDSETTLLMIASLNKNDSYKIVSLLIKKGADVNACNNKGSTALLYSSLRGKTEVVKLLLKKGANPNHPNSITTPLMIAASQKEYEICKMLIEKGADKYAVDEKGITVLDYAKSGKDKRIIELLR